MEDRLTSQILWRIKKLHKLTQSLSKEKDHQKLLELILFAMKDITNADGGTLYTPTKEQTLRFEILVNTSLNMAMGGSSGVSIPFKDLPLYNLAGVPNQHNIACSCYLSGKYINITDAYQTHEFDFSGARIFDREVGYRTKSVLAIPLKNVENKVIGVIQLVNARDNLGQTIHFTKDSQAFAEFLGSHAAITLTNFKLTEELSGLVESLARVIATAIDDKSPYTGKHCYRVPKLAMMLTEAAVKAQVGNLKKFQMTAEQKDEMKLAALLHDCGKVSTPVHVIDKATKLETIFDRVEMIETRFAVKKKDLENQLLKQRIKQLENTSNEGKSGAEVIDFKALTEEYNEQIKELDESLAFIKHCNIGQEFMPREQQDRIKYIATDSWPKTEDTLAPLLSTNEVENLNIPKGTLTDNEKEIINHHIITTINMLEQLELPTHLKGIPKIAGAHHEKMNGTGYPYGLKGEEIPIQSRIICIADVFEALTAKDRPYKKGKTLSESLKILGFMKLDGHIDPDLFYVFIDRQIYLEFALKYLDPSQVDEVDVTTIPGYVLPEEREEVVPIPIPAKKAA
ncbi:MAG: HD domain-containing protein [Bacteriovoracaceae bacterium]|nr:HD domain-containing protein [Bacteriovoracaceae bacterium]